MKRRRVLRSVVLLGALSGCASSGRDEATDTEPASDTASETPTETATATRTEASPTETVPPYSRDLNELQFNNKREETVRLQVVVTDESEEKTREFSLALESGEKRTYDSETYPILDGAVHVEVTIGGTTYTRSKQDGSTLVVDIVADGVNFEEYVT